MQIRPLKDIRQSSLHKIIIMEIVELVLTSLCLLMLVLIWVKTNSKNGSNGIDSFRNELKNESKENRTKTFPLDWAAQNSLQVSIDNVADAGYIYCPKSLSYTIVSSPEECKLTQWRKLSAYQELSETSPFTICPKPNCQKVIDWSIVSQKYNLKHQRIRDIPDIGHCSYGK